MLRCFSCIVLLPVDFNWFVLVVADDVTSASARDCENGSLEGKSESSATKTINLLDLTKKNGLISVTSK